MSTPPSPELWYFGIPGESPDLYPVTATGEAYGADPFHEFGSTVEDAWQDFLRQLDAMFPNADGSGGSVTDQGGHGPLGTDVPAESVAAALGATASQLPDLAWAFPADYLPQWMAKSFIDAGMPATGVAEPVLRSLSTMAETDVSRYASATAAPLAPAVPPAAEPPTPAVPTTAPAAGSARTEDWAIETALGAISVEEIPSTLQWLAAVLHTDEQTAALKLLSAGQARGIGIPRGWPPTAHPAADATRKRTPDDVTTAARPDNARRKRHRPEAPDVAFASDAERWVLSAALSEDSLRQIVDSARHCGNPLAAALPSAKGAIIGLGERMGLTGTVTEIRKGLRRKADAGDLDDPGCYTARWQPADLTQLLTTPDFQWVIDIALSRGSLRSVIEQNEQAGIQFVHDLMELAARISDMGRAFGIQGNAKEVRRELRRRWNAGLLARVDGKWVVGENGTSPTATVTL
ncbi:hypothetical protein ACFQ78_32065 [Streptomyces sp. NPDC056519]|uniref:hypothetical protein n=1 Tax=Streptomyces sp. NPDC056519 TaxID=3345849 RepID=UPI00368748B2